MLSHQCFGLFKGWSKIFRFKYADGFTAESFCHFDVIDAIAVYFAGVNVFERQLDAVIHIKSALRLANQAEIGVIHQHMDVRNVELRANSYVRKEWLEV